MPLCFLPASGSKFEALTIYINEQSCIPYQIYIVESYRSQIIHIIWGESVDIISECLRAFKLVLLRSLMPYQLMLGCAPQEKDTGIKRLVNLPWKVEFLTAPTPLRSYANNTLSTIRTGPRIVGWNGESNGTKDVSCNGQNPRFGPESTQAWHLWTR